MTWIVDRWKRAELVPKLMVALEGYDRRKAAGDLTAGLTVGLVALPLAMAFSISSGLTPQAGIYTAVVAGAIISVCGDRASKSAAPPAPSSSSSPTSWLDTASTACSCAH